MNSLIAIVGVVHIALNILIWTLVIQAILSWLIAFNVVSDRRGFVAQLNYGLRRLTEPLLAPIRRVVPDLGGIDISPMVLILAAILIQRLLPALILDLAGPATL